MRDKGRLENIGLAWTCQNRIRVENDGGDGSDSVKTRDQFTL